MAPDPATHERVAALTGGSPAPVADPKRPRPESPDPDFWGTEPRTVRRSRPPGPGSEPHPVGDRWSAVVDRARDARLEVGIGVVAIALLALVAGIVWYRMGVSGGAPAPRAAGREPGAAGSTPSTGGFRATPVTTLPGGGAQQTAARASTRGATVVVHVAGAVAKPGVLLMPAGARVIDAVEGAGGATADADLDRLNLAAKLIDGQRILVVKIGAPAVADPATGGGAAALGEPGALIDLNAATTAQLETLPGIGPALAGAIVAERDRRGGFRSINELREVRGIGEVRFADLRDRVTV